MCTRRCIFHVSYRRIYVYIKRTYSPYGIQLYFRRVSILQVYICVVLGATYSTYTDIERTHFPYGPQGLYLVSINSTWEYRWSRTGIYKWSIWNTGVYMSILVVYSFHM